ncbi:MAG: PIG-L family deacetylase [Candidatus Omnitrophica bacterium]|nr:PIG-L family deacetylase [Candidatus Omnitrophota bacterium]
MKVLAIAAHPDDETLGCGGTLLKHRAAADQLFWLIATEAAAPRWPSNTIASKRAEVAQVAERYQMRRCFRLGFPAAALEAVPTATIIERVRGVLTHVRPDIIYVVHGGDVQTDHVTLFAALMSALKAFTMAQSGVRRILSYETLSSTDAAPASTAPPFLPTVFSDITPYLERKLSILRLYRSERHANPLPRAPESVRALARYRGATVGVPYAEAFMLVRELVPAAR